MPTLFCCDLFCLCAGASIQSIFCEMFVIYIKV